MANKNKKNNTHNRSVWYHVVWWTEGVDLWLVLKQNSVILQTDCILVTILLTKRINIRFLIDRITPHCVTDKFYFQNILLCFSKYLVLFNKNNINEITHRSKGCSLSFNSLRIYLIRVHKHARPVPYFLVQFLKGLIAHISGLLNDECSFYFTMLGYGFIRTQKDAVEILLKQWNDPFVAFKHLRLEL